MGAAEILFIDESSALSAVDACNGQKFDMNKSERKMRVTLAECYKYWSTEILKERMN